MKAANDNAHEPPAGIERTAKPCPLCGKPSVTVFKPFCSRRCSDVDLHRWLGGHYAIPAREPSDDDDVENNEGPQ